MTKRNKIALTCQLLNFETSTRMTRSNLSPAASLPRKLPSNLHPKRININPQVPNLNYLNRLIQQSSAMTSRVVEITIISCEDLTTSSFKKHMRKNARGVIRMPHCNNSPWSTTLDVKGGAYPRWNEKFTMEMPAFVNWFDVEIWSGTEKVIGTARIPASDFVGGILPDGYLNFLSYRLRERNGEFNGIVNVSVRVAGGKKEEGRIGFGCGYAIGVPSGAVVTGIPVCSGTKS